MGIEYKLFPTLVMQFPGVFKAPEMKSISKKLLSTNTIEHVNSGSNPDPIQGGGRSSFTPVPVSECCIVTNLGIRDRIKPYLDEYTSRADLSPVEIVYSWFNVQDIGSTLTQHDHPGSEISAALYVNVDANSSYNYFENPNSLSSFHNFGGNTEYSFQNYRIQPQIGDLIVFPSWLRHGSLNTRNNTKNRIVISLNTVKK